MRGQSAVALIVVPDDTGECVIRILGCFETTADAEAWVQGTASRRVTEHDIVVAPTCEWLYPNATASASNTHYREDELQRIMDTAMKNPAAVRTYKEWQREREAREAAAAAAMAIDHVTDAEASNAAGGGDDVIVEASDQSTAPEAIS